MDFHKESHKIFTYNIGMFFFAALLGYIYLYVFKELI
jgi:hypothetical protein